MSEFEFKKTKPKTATAPAVPSTPSGSTSNANASAPSTANRRQELQNAAAQLFAVPDDRPTRGTSATSSNSPKSNRLENKVEAMSLNNSPAEVKLDSRRESKASTAVKSEPAPVQKVDSVTAAASKALTNSNGKVNEESEDEARDKVEDIKKVDNKSLPELPPKTFESDSSRPTSPTAAMDSSMARSHNATSTLSLGDKLNTELNNLKNNITTQAINIGNMLGAGNLIMGSLTSAGMPHNPPNSQTLSALETIESIETNFKDLSFGLAKYSHFLKELSGIGKHFKQTLQANGYKQPQDSQLRPILLDMATLIGCSTGSNTTSFDDLIRVLTNLQSFVDTFIDKAIPDIKLSAKKEFTTRTGVHNQEKQMEEVKKQIESNSAHNSNEVLSTGGRSGTSSVVASTNTSPTNIQQTSVEERRQSASFWTKLGQILPQSPDLFKQTPAQLQSRLLDMQGDLDQLRKKHDAAVDELVVKVQMMNQKVEMDLTAKLKEVTTILRNHFNTVANEINKSVNKE